jgi:uncharacterized damage-inducible protein DinB
MALNTTLLPEFDQETENTRKVIERIPEDKLDWKPHDKSMAFVGLASHLANLPSWTVLTLDQDSFDMAPPGQAPLRQEPVATVQAALDLFDKNVADGRAALEGADDPCLLGPWSLLAHGQTVFKMPRIAVLRSMVLNHMVHHRAQLGVYLRLNDVALPALYGPSADENP